MYKGTAAPSELYDSEQWELNAGLRKKCKIIPARIVRRIMTFEQDAIWSTS